MENRKDITVPMPEELSDAIEENLDYGDSKAGWIRDAIQMRLEEETEDPEGKATQRTAPA